MTPAELQRAAELKAAWDTGAIRGPELDEARELFGRLIQWAKPLDDSTIDLSAGTEIPASGVLARAVRHGFVRGVRWREPRS